MEMRCDQVIIISVSNECRAGSCSAHNVLEFALPRKDVYKNCEFVHWCRLTKMLTCHLADAWIYSCSSRLRFVF
jgi:hypothetical protein